MRTVVIEKVRSHGIKRHCPHLWNQQCILSVHENNKCAPHITIIARPQHHRHCPSLPHSNATWASYRSMWVCPHTQWVVADLNNVSVIKWPGIKPSGWNGHQVKCSCFTPGKISLRFVDKWMFSVGSQH